MNDAVHVCLRRRRFDILAELRPKLFEVGLHRCGVAEDESSKHAEDRVVYFATLGDRKLAPASSGRDLVGTSPAELFVVHAGP